MSITSSKNVRGGAMARRLNVSVIAASRCASARSSGPDMLRPSPPRISAKRPRHEGAPRVDGIVAEQSVIEPVAGSEILHDEKALFGVTAVEAWRGIGSDLIQELQAGPLGEKLRRLGTFGACIERLAVGEAWPLD